MMEFLREWLSVSKALGEVLFLIFAVLAAGVDSPRLLFPGSD